MEENTPKPLNEVEESKKRFIEMQKHNISLESDMYWESFKKTIPIKDRSVNDMNLVKRAFKAAFMVGATSNETYIRNFNIMANKGLIKQEILDDLIKKNEENPVLKN